MYKRQGSDSGASGNGMAEKNLTLAIVLAAKRSFDNDSRFQMCIRDRYADFAMYQIKRTVKDQFGDFDKEAYRTSQEQYNKEKD